MPLTQKKTVSILLEQCGDVQDRCAGYREELIAAISDIIDYEQAHRVSRTDIQKKISDKCNAVANLLAARRDSNDARGR
jgi:hypothetical protein